VHGGGKRVRGKPVDGGLEAGLIGLDREQILGVLVLDQVAGMVSLGVQRIRGHDHPAQVEVVQQRAELGDLVGGVVDFALRDDGALTVEHRGQ
jgi:hypothetical protein